MHRRGTGGTAALVLTATAASVRLETRVILGHTQLRRNDRYGVSRLRNIGVRCIHDRIITYS